MTWDSANPANNSSASSDMRANFEAVEGIVGGVNLCKDPTFLIWAAGDATTPTHWLMSGTGAACARLVETAPVGAMTARLTAGGGATAYLYQHLITAASYDDFLEGQAVSLGAWVWCNDGSGGRLVINDGATQTESVWHTGGGSWEWLTVTHTISASATLVWFGLSAAPSADPHIVGAHLVLGDIPPSRFHPAPCVYGTLGFKAAGDLTGRTGAMDYYAPSRPGLVKYVQLLAPTAPTGAALIVDVNTWDGSAYTTMFSTRPQIAISGNFGGAAPDGTYARRCLSTLVGTTGYPSLTGAYLSVDIDQVGSTVAGQNLLVMCRILQFTSPLEAFLGPTEIS